MLFFGDPPPSGGTGRKLVKQILSIASFLCDASFQHPKRDLRHYFLGLPLRLLVCMCTCSGMEPFCDWLDVDLCL